MIFLLLSCFIHKTSLSGIVDYVGDESCTIVLESSDMVIISSSVCKNSKEGDPIIFYARKK